MTNASFLDYRMPTSLDLPMIDTVMVEVPNPGHPYGVRGVGEVPIVPPPAALANAIYRAIGVRLTRAADVAGPGGQGAGGEDVGNSSRNRAGHLSSSSAAGAVLRLLLRQHVIAASVCCRTWCGEHPLHAVVDELNPA